jgi:hypothetical protein
MPDGKRFVVRFAPAVESTPYLNVIIGWFDELRSSVPTKQTEGDANARRARRWCERRSSFRGSI